MQSLRGIFPKTKDPPKRDFIKENVISLQLLQQKKQQSNNLNEAHRLKSKSLQRIPRSTSKSRFASQAIIQNTNIVQNELDNPRKCRPLSVQSRDACSQTETVDDDLFLKDVIIRLPSAGLWKSANNVNELYKKSEEIDGDEIDASNMRDNEAHAGTSTMVNSASVVFATDTMEPDIQSNLLTNDTKSLSQFSSRCENRIVYPYALDDASSMIPPTYRYGELPTYLRQMKIKSAEKARLNALIDPDCPPNHNVLSDVDRIESLDIARQKYKELINELNRLPMTSSTLRVRDRRIAIENELRQLDSTIDVFSRSKVYIKDDKITSN